MSRESSHNRGTLQYNNFIRCENKRVSFYRQSCLSESLFAVLDYPVSFEHQPGLNLHFTWKFLFYESTYVKLCDAVLCLASSRSIGFLLVIVRLFFSLWLRMIFSRDVSKPNANPIRCCLFVKNVFTLPLADVTPKIIKILSGLKIVSV